MAGCFFSSSPQKIDEPMSSKKCPEHPPKVSPTISQQFKKKQHLTSKIHPRFSPSVAIGCSLPSFRAMAVSASLAPWIATWRCCDGSWEVDFHGDSPSCSTQKRNKLTDSLAPARIDRVNSIGVWTCMDMLGYG